MFSSGWLPLLMFSFVEMLLYNSYLKRYFRNLRSLRPFFTLIFLADCTNEFVRSKKHIGYLLFCRPVLYWTKGKRNKGERFVKNNKEPLEYHLEFLSDDWEQPHLHQEAELIYVLEGSATVLDGETTHHLGEEDVFLVNRNRKHALSVGERALVFQVFLSPRLFQQYLEQNHPFFRCDSASGGNEDYNSLRLHLRRLMNRFVNHPDSPDFQVTACVYQMLNCLTDFLVEQPGTEGHDDRTDEIVWFIESNYDQGITLNELADRLHLTYSYLSRSFKKTVGMNFPEYLNTVRLRHAVEDLLYTEKSMTQIAMDNGFSNAAALNKAFRASYGTTPFAYKKQRKGSEDTPRPAVDQRQLRQRVASYLASNGGNKNQPFALERQTICIDGAKKEPYQKVWMELINIGSANDLLSAKMQQHLLFLHSHLGFRYVRFWNIFSEAMELRLRHQADYLNFTKVDEILDFLVKNDLKPYIELGDKPAEIWSTTTSNLKMEEGEPCFRSLSEFRYVFEQFIHHLITRYRADEVKTWRFEAWRDTRLVRQEGGDLVSYFQIFHVASQTLHRILPEAQLGGCGLKVSDPEMQTFLEEWHAQQSPDFLTIMSYPYEPTSQHPDPETGYTKRSPDPRFLLHNIIRTKKIMQEVGMDCPLYVCEWNCTISSRNFVNDSCHKGSYILKNVIDCLGQVDMLGYWSGSDLLGTYYDSRNILSGCAGLLTKDGICKPAFYAFQFLHRMGNYLVQTGENYMLTTSGHFSYYLICHNYRAPGRGFNEKSENLISVEEIRAFSASEPLLHLSFQLDHLPVEHYYIKTFSVSPHAGSVIDEWFRLNLMSNMRQEDLDYLSRICTPHISLRQMNTEQQALRFDVELQPEEFQLIHIYHEAE